jgi:phosphotransferase family enzyme
VPEPDLVRWASAAWRTGVEAWVTAELTARGHRLTGGFSSPRTRFWSTHLVVETDAGRFWFKENCREQRFEARLVAALARVCPDRVLTLTATEPKQGWLLSPDQGPVLRDAGPVTAAVWRRLLVDYAVLQREVLTRRLDLAALGLTVLRPEDAGAHLARRVEELQALPVGHAGRLPDDEADRLRALAPEVAAWSATVADVGLPPTLDHSDLHSGNAFSAAPGSPLRVFDFGDSVVSSPLCSLLVPVRAMTVDAGVGGLSTLELGRVLDAYLEVFSDLVPATSLRAAVPAALELAKLNRQESWRRVLLAADDAGRAEFAGAPTGWLALIGR